LAAVLLSICILCFTSYYWPITDPYYPFNDGSNGCSNLLTQTPSASLLFSYSENVPSTNSLLAIIGPSIPFNRVDSNRVSSFLHSGGVVLLADDFGSGNSLLQNLNVSARFAGKAISDLYFYSRQPTYPLISIFAPDLVTRNITLLLMSHPSYIEAIDNKTVDEIAFSSPLSFVDNYDNGTISPNEPTRSYTVMASIHLGNGLLVLVSNAALFTNGSIGLFDNTMLLRNLLSLARGGITIDVSHVSKASLSDLRVAFKRNVDYAAVALNSTLAKTVITIGLIAGFTAALGWQSRLHRNRSDGSKQEISSRKKREPQKQAYISNLSR
jgi:hypothetical protein